MLKRIPPTSATYKKIDKKLQKKLAALNTPAKIQDFLNELPFNFEKKRETYRSVEKALAAREAHCFEGALIAAAALEMHGHKPLLLDLRTTEKDVDHVVALFRRGKYWGAISKTNHPVLRYREPVYESVHELAMSYFHEYFLNDGTKTMRKFSKPFDLSKIKIDWRRSDKDLFALVDALDRSPHTDVLPKNIKLRKADKIEIKAGKITDSLSN